MCSGPLSSVLRAPKERPRRSCDVPHNFLVPSPEPSRPMHSRLITLALVGTTALAGHALPLLAQAPRSLGIDTTNFDRSVRPQDDLFRFVNGGWLKRTPIPSDPPRGGTFDELHDPD